MVGLCGFVCQCCMCNNLGKHDGISVCAMGVMESLELRVVVRASCGDESDESEAWAVSLTREAK